MKWPVGDQGGGWGVSSHFYPLSFRFLYSGVALWNSFLTDIRVYKTLGEFKTKLGDFSFEWTNDTASLTSSTFVFIYFHSNK